MGFSPPFPPLISSGGIRIFLKNWTWPPSDFLSLGRFLSLSTFFLWDAFFLWVVFFLLDVFFLCLREPPGGRLGGVGRGNLTEGCRRQQCKTRCFLPGLKPGGADFKKKIFLLFAEGQKKGGPPISFRRVPKGCLCFGPPYCSVVHIHCCRLVSPSHIHMQRFFTSWPHRRQKLSPSFSQVVGCAQKSSSWVVASFFILFPSFFG